MSREVSIFPRLLLVGLVATASPIIWAQRDARQAFDLVIPQAPTPVVVDGRTRLVYELHLTSFAAEPLHLERIQWFADHGSTPLAELRGETLSAALGRPGLDANKDKSIVAPGMRAIVYLDLAFDAAPASTLRHRVEFKSVKDGASSGIEGARVAPNALAKLALGPPLRDGPWIAIYSSEWERGHRRTLYAIDGKARIPGRHAIDWIKLDADGKEFAGDGKNKNDWYGYGADVLAVADATVVDLRDDVAEPASVSDDNPRVPIGDATGNFVALALADGRYAFYEHFRPGSIKVRRGERVRRGEVVGALGYTGQSTGPHLHFHVADAPAPLAAEGLPYVFESWRPLGAYRSPEAREKGGRWTPASTKAMVVREFPAPFAVIEFVDGTR